MFNKKFRVVLVLLVVSVLGLSIMAEASAPKYVFYLIGDGMGAAQRQAAEYFLQAQTGDNSAKLMMNQFPVAGLNTTHSADSLVTDSAAAGTALATGYKTNNGVISQLPDGTNARTLVEEAEARGMATGLVSTTRLTHATVAVFASHNVNRNEENDIAYDFLDSGVDFFAGGGYRHFVPQDWEWGKSKRKDKINVAQEFYNNDYNVFVTEDDTAKFRDFTPEGKEKVFAVLTYSHMPYELDREDKKVPSLKEMTAKGIEVLEKYEDGFFMMVEGGRIDHACHANDPAGAIHDTLVFDAAVAEAYDFYKEHPEETLIVVLADHETGGFGLGFGKNYFLKMDELMDVKYTTADILNYDFGKYDGDRDKFFKFIEENIGLDNLTAQETVEIEEAMDLVDKGVKDADTMKYYGGYDPVAIAATHILSERANVYWTTYAHSGTTVPMSAIGVGAEKLGGFKDNTEISKALFDLMGFNMTKVADANYVVAGK